MKFLVSLSFSFLVIFASSYQKCQAQQPVNQDYIITLSGEVEYGQILRSFDQSNYKVVKFQSRSGDRKDFAPHEINGFGLDNGRIFRSMKLPGMRTNVFVQQLFSGTFSLLSYQDDIYIETEVELIYMYKILEENNFAGRVVTNYRKPFVDDLLVLFAGNCGNTLKKSIEKTYYSEQSFLDLLIKYHKCENLPYTVHIESIPRLRLSPTLSVGGNMMGTLISDRSDNRTDVFEQQFLPSIQMGLRFYQFRIIPKFSFDLGVGKSEFSSMVRARYENPNQLFTGTEKYSISSTFFPFSLNYSFQRNRNFESFVGLGIIHRISTIESEFSIMDSKSKAINSTVLTEVRLTSYKERITSPTFKLGTHIRHSKKLGFIVELQTSLLPSSYSVRIENNIAKYSEVINSLLIGIRY
ncbi:hypothetical protein [Mongoliitalea daihaiensis]|uniref:hypothetical protein n=1 Tax=Mongoliitalea daihaiensis TaxID=2782006 RepID=UPI001F4700F9|nr:hypothetical protein [Mongoliitalea daihaiensis]UJP66888.1 hypothetical protein IPZ59_09985 [Mongoliitalea daihaiensis]